MLILHGSFYKGRFFLWGEKSRDGDFRISKPRGRKPANPGPRPFPFDATQDNLTSSLRQAGLVCEAEAWQAGQATVWLPTSKGQPVPSSPLIAELPVADSKVALAPWTVSVVQLINRDCLDFLCACTGKQMLAPGISIGRDVVYWAAAMRLAGALVARQQYLPGVKKDGHGYRARWQPVVYGSHAGDISRLASVMPRSCRALALEKTEIPPAVPASVVLAEFIEEIVDGLVRLKAAEVLAPPLAPESKGAGRGRLKEFPAKSPVFDSVHDQWLYALGTAEGNLKADGPALAALEAQVREWQRQVVVDVTAPFRLCFRLEEPGSHDADNLDMDKSDADNRDADKQDVRSDVGRGQNEDDKWYIRYLLQSASDPSLLLSAKDAWNSRGRLRALFNEGSLQAKEYLLSALGRASAVCEQIEASLKSSIPEGYTMNTAQAHSFLSNQAAALEMAGFGVMLPAWWTRKGTKTRLSVSAKVNSPKLQGGGNLSLDQIVSIDWEVALGGQRISPDELKTLAKLKSSLVKVRGRWVELSAQEIEAAMNFWKKKSAGTVSLRDVVRMTLGGGGNAGSMPVDGVTATGWVADFLQQLNGQAQYEEVLPPAGLRAALRPYQARGFSWLHFLQRWGLGACLADDMGLGKTVQTLALIQHKWEQDSLEGSGACGGRGPVLLICPTSVMNNWQKEAARFTPELPVMVHHGTERMKSDAFVHECQKQAMVISSYALLHRDVEVLRQVPWSGLILDEAQNIKNAETRQAKAARLLQAGFRIALTGTPVENNVGDLWSVMEFLNPGLLGTQTEFKRRFFIPIQAERDVEATQSLKRLTGPFILRRLKTDKSIIADLPEKIEMKDYCNLTREQASLYAAVVAEATEGLESAEGIQRKGLVLSTLSKLKQICNHPAQFLGDNSSIAGRSGKLTRLTEMLEEIVEKGERALIFSQFTEMGELLKRHLQEVFGQEALFLHGGVAKKRRDEMVERFQAGFNAPSVFILSLKAGGTGLNLTRASHVFHFDRWWNPAVENQATDRAFRIGQTKNVQVHKLICAGTLEEKIDEMIERKQEVAEHVVGTGEGWLTELSTAELKDLFALRKEAIGE